MKRVVLAGVLGGLALFLWESVAHMMLPLGEMGFRAVPNDQAFAAFVKEQFKDDGLYIFPAMQQQPPKGTPAGILVVHPGGMDELTPRQLGSQVSLDIVVMMAAAWVLSKSAVSGYLPRAGMVAALALFPILRVHLPYWNWYGFPASFILAESITHIAGFAIGGLILAKLVR